MSSYDVGFINPFLEAVTSVLTTMARVEATPGKPYINTERTAVGDVTGIIGVTGTLTGVISVTFDKNAILKIANNMLEESYADIDANIIDAVGELTNMITGQARMHLAQQGMSLQASTPSVITGRGHSISHIGPAPILSIPFATPDGHFVVEVTMARKPESGKTATRPVPAAKAAAPASGAPQDGAKGQQPVYEKKSLWRKPPNPDKK